MSAAKTIYLFVNGIATWPGNFTNWNKRAVTFTHTHTDFRAEAFEYFTTPLTRPFKEDQRAKHFARAIKEYSQAGWNIICVGQPSAGWMPVLWQTATKSCHPWNRHRKGCPARMFQADPGALFECH